MHTQPPRPAPSEESKSRVRRAPSGPTQFDVPQTCRLLYQDLEYLLKWQEYLRVHLSKVELDADGALHFAYSEQVSTILAWTTVRAERAALHLYYLIVESEQWGESRGLDDRPVSLLSVSGVRRIERDGNPWGVIAAGSRQLVDYLWWGGGSRRAEDLGLIVGWLNWQFVAEFVDLSSVAPNPWLTLLPSSRFNIKKSQVEHSSSDEETSIACCSAAWVLVHLAISGESYFSAATIVSLLSAAASLVDTSEGLDKGAAFKTSFKESNAVTWYFMAHRLIASDTSLAQKTLIPRLVAVYERSEIAKRALASSPYNEACGLACAGEVTQALDSLERALLDEPSVSDAIWATRDPDLEVLRTHDKTSGRWKHTFASVGQIVEEADQLLPLWFGESGLSPLMRDES